MVTRTALSGAILFFVAEGLNITSRARPHFSSRLAHDEEMRLATDCPWLGALHKCQVAKENCEQELVNLKAAANSTSPALEECQNKLLEANTVKVDDPGLAASLQIKVNELTTQLRDAKLKAELEPRNADAKERHGSAVEKMADDATKQLGKDLADAQEEAKNLKTQAEEEAKKATDATKKADECANQVQTLKTKVGNLEKNLEEAEGDLSRERSAEAERVRSMGTEDSAVRELQAKQGELDNARFANIQLERELKDAMDKAAHLEEKNRKLTALFDKADKDFKNTSAKLNNKHTEAKESKEEADTCKKQVTDLKGQNEKLTSENEKLTASAGELRKEFQKLETSLEEWKKNKENCDKAARTAATTAENKVGDVSSQLRKAEGEVDNLELKVSLQVEQLKNQRIERDKSEKELQEKLQTSEQSLQETEKKLTKQVESCEQVKAFVKAIPAASLLVTTPDQVRTWRVYDKSKHHLDDNLRSSLDSAIHALKQLPDDALPAATPLQPERRKAQGDLIANWQAAMKKFWPKPPDAGSKMCCKDRKKESYIGNSGVCWSPWQDSKLFAFFKVEVASGEETQPDEDDVDESGTCAEEYTRRKAAKERITEPLHFERFTVDGPGCKYTANVDGGDTREARAIVATACAFESAGQMLRLLGCCTTIRSSSVKGNSVSTAVSAASIRGGIGKKIKKVPRPNGTSTMGPVGRFFHRAHDFFHPA